MVRESHLKNHQFFWEHPGWWWDANFQSATYYLCVRTTYTFSYYRLPSVFQGNFVKSYFVLQDDSCHPSTDIFQKMPWFVWSVLKRWLNIDKSVVVRMNGSRWSWWALRSNQCWHHPVCAQRMNEHQRVRHKRRHPHRICCCCNCGQSCYCCCLLETLSR